MMMASLGHRVISFEPTPPTFVALAAALDGNLANSPQWEVQLVNAGVSNAIGAATILTQPKNAGGALTTGVGDVNRSAYRRESNVSHLIINQNWQPYKIWLSTLDTEVHESVDLMKMDCQGHELRALQGAKKLLDGPGVKVIKLEFYPEGIRQVGDDPIALLKFLDAAGYEIKHGKNTVTPKSFPRLVMRYSTGFVDLIALKRAAV